MFSGRWEDRVDRDKDGYVFLDLDPTLFSIILRYLVSMHNYGMDAEHLELRPVPNHLEDEFRLMLAHLGLEEIIQPKINFKWSPLLKTPSVILKKGDTIAVSDGTGTLRHHVLSHDVFYGGIYKFRVLVEFLEEWALLGIIGEDVRLGPADDACKHPTIYGWGSNGEVFVGGVESSWRGYPGRKFQTGNLLTIVLDGRYSTLTLMAPTDNGTMLEYKIPNLIGNRWRFVLSTYYGSSAMEVTV